MSWELWQETDRQTELEDTILSNGGERAEQVVSTVIFSNFHALGCMSHRLTQGEGTATGEPLWIQVHILTLRDRGWQLSPALPMGVQSLRPRIQMLTAQHVFPTHWKSSLQAWNDTSKHK